MPPAPVIPELPVPVDPGPAAVTGGAAVVVDAEVVAGADPRPPVPAPSAPTDPARPDADGVWPEVVDGEVPEELVLVEAGAAGATAPVSPGDRTMAHEMATAPIATTTSSVPNDLRNAPMIKLSYVGARC